MPKVKRLSKIIHPNSRKALELASKEHHKNRAMRSQEKTKNRANILIKKLLWFKSEITNKNEAEDEMETSEIEQTTLDSEFKSKPAFTNDDLHKLIEKYFHRFDQELEQINTKKSIGKRNIGQHFSREKAIEMTLESEKNEYQTTGLVVPDLTNAENLKLFRNWNEQATHLQTIKLKTLKKN